MASSSSYGGVHIPSSSSSSSVGIQAMDFQPSSTPPKLCGVFGSEGTTARKGSANSPITSMKYHGDGKYLYVVSEGDANLRVVDCEKGTSDQPPLKFEHEGIHLVEPTHHNQCVLYAGKGSRSQPLGQRNAVHYLSLHDNKLLRNFRGHSGEVTNLSMCPIDDTFVSSSTDRTVRLWDLQQAGCIAELELPSNVHGTPHATYDSTGLVFAISAAMASKAGNYIHMYDARKYDVGPFAELKITQQDVVTALSEKANVRVSRSMGADLSTAGWTGIQLNTSGKQILVSAQQGMGLILDGFDGTVLNAYVAVQPKSSDSTSSSGSSSSSSRTSDKPFAGCFTPDDRTLLTGGATCGSQIDGAVYSWSTDSGKFLHKLDGVHQGSVACLVANPKYAQFATACSYTALWGWQ